MTDSGRLFSSLKAYRKILVTGPQRAGTTITAQILAAESGYRCIDEKDFDWRDIGRFRSFIADEERMVIQCPTMSHIIEQFGGPDHLIVFMHRNPKDIIASQRRISWRAEVKEKAQYRGMVPYMWHLFTPISVLKYMHWHFEQKQKVSNSVDLNYESLSFHPLWVAK